MSPSPLQENLSCALVHHQAGRLHDAEKGYRDILRQHPDLPDVLHLLGLICHQTARTTDAIELLQRAVAANPGVADFHDHLGLALSAAARWDEASSSFQRALALDSHRAQTHSNLGLALQGNGLLREAIDSYRRALELKGDFPEAHFNLARALHDQGQPSDAIKLLQRAIASRPGYFEAFVEMGNVLARQKEFPGAVGAYRKALAINPDAIEVEFNLANALAEAWELDQAIELYRQIVSARPDYADAWTNLGGAHKACGDWKQAMACYQRAAQLRPGPEADENLLCALPYLPDPDPQRILEAYVRWDEAHTQPLHCGTAAHGCVRTQVEEKLSAFGGPQPRAAVPHGAPATEGPAPSRTHRQPLRIGYVSPDFCNHPVGQCILPLLREHVPQSVEVFCYADVTRADELTARVQNEADVWRRTERLSHQELADLIRRDHIDVLVDLAGHTRKNRLLVFAQKPAPVQVTWLGWPGTTGMKAMDFRLSDPYLDPPEENTDWEIPHAAFRIQNSAFSSEKVLLLPHSFWCYGVPEEAPPVNTPPFAKEAFITFGCLNSFFKINDPLLELWAQILGEVPKSRLLLRVPPGKAQDRVRTKLQNFGIDPRRLEIVGVAAKAEYWRLYQRIDICLDPFPYNGHTTSLDALWMGVPLVTLAGRLPTGRAGVNTLSNVGLGHLIAQTAMQYKEIATQLAADAGQLIRLRDEFRERLQRSPIMDAKAFARDLEEAYRQMYATSCSTPDLSK